MSDERRELGDLKPIRRVLGELTALEVEDRRRRGDHDPGVHVLADAAARITAALEEAVETPRELTLEEYAAEEGITVEAARKRWRRGRIVGAVRDPSGRIVIPMSAVA